MRIKGLIQAFAFVTALLSLVTFAGHAHRFLELFSHFRLQYFLATAVLALLLFVLRSRRWAAIMLIVTAINAVPVLPWYIGEAEASQSSGPRIKLLLSNVYAGNEDTRQLLDLIDQEQADLVFLQEVTDACNRELAALREDYPYSLNIPREDNFGIAVLSRHPFSNASVIQSPPHGYPTLIVEIVIGDRAATFVTTHPAPPLGDAGFDARNIQLANIAAVIAEAAGPRVLIGDLNTSMWGEQYELLVEKTNLVDARHGFGVLPSWPTQLPFAMIPIDHCLVSEEFRVTDVRSGPDIGSDHLPLIVELQLEDDRTGQAIR